MARIAINAVVHIPADARVMEIGCVVVPVATRALEDRVVRGIRVAGRTDAVRPAMSLGEPGMVEHRAGPGRCRVAGGTGCWEPGGRVVGIIRTLVIRCVTVVAVGWKSRVVIVHMATRAGHAGVSTGKWKGRVVMIKNALGPKHGVVTQGAVGRKTGVIDRCQGITEICLVASNASRAGQAVVVIDVAGSAGDARVRAGQRKAGRGVIECRTRPR